MQFVLLMGLLLASCQWMQRHPDVARTQRSMKETPLPDDQIRLKQLENKISSRVELEQYSKLLPWFENTQERIQFLELDGVETRQKWIQRASIPQRIKKIESSFMDLAQNQDIAIGMPESLVKMSWGEPTRVDVSGDIRFKNYRWHYDKQISSSEGFRREVKTVYLEGGKVTGWDKN